MDNSKEAARQRERYATDSDYRTRKIASNLAYQRAHPEAARAASARWRAKTHPLRTPEERFWAKVDRSGECWPWMGVRDSRGYGYLTAAGRGWRAPRYVIAVLEGRPIPEGCYVRHRCDNPPCVRPDHLDVGTPAENVADRIRRGRPGSPGPIRPSHGSAHWAAKLDEAQVGEIRDLYATGVWLQREIAARYGIRQTQVSRIVTGRRWAD